MFFLFTSAYAQKLTDGVHASLAGAQLMAHAWLQAFV
jgi:lysophospholipase L1-like esterase